MPGQQLQTTAFLLARLPSGSDSFEQLTAFCAEHGVLHCLRRIASKKPTPNSTPLDIFDEAELALESSNQGRTWFIKEHRLVRRHAGIGRSYAALQCAAAVASLVARNPVSDESRPGIADLLRHTFSALETSDRPDIVWLKALYCFLRDEGYPVKQQWWPLLAATDQAATAQLLNQPLAAQTADATTVAQLTRQLEAWIAAETELRL